MPVASTWPEGSSARAVSVIVRVSGAIRLVSSGSRALRALPASSRVPTRKGSRSVSSHAVARRCQRAAAGRSHHPSNTSVGVHDGLPSASGQVASSPAAAATSTSSAVADSSSCTTSADALRSRTATAPVRSATGGAVPQWSTSSSTRRTTSNAAPAAARSTWSGERSEVAISGARSTRSRVVWPPRTAIWTSPGVRTSPGRPGTSRPRASSSSAGDVASAGVIVWRAFPASASPRPASTWSSIARAAGDSSAISARTSSGVRPVTGWSSDSDPSASGTPVSGRSPASPSQARARSATRAQALSTAPPSALRMWARSDSVVGPAEDRATRASRTESSRRVSRSRARVSDDRVAARDASCAQSAGAGVARSGRSRRSVTSRSSGQLRSWSASDRCPLPGAADEVPIIPTLAGCPAGPTSRETP